MSTKNQFLMSLITIILDFSFHFASSYTVKCRQASPAFLLMCSFIAIYACPWIIGCQSDHEANRRAAAVLPLTFCYLESNQCSFWCILVWKFILLSYDRWMLDSCWSIMKLFVKFVVFYGVFLLLYFGNGISADIFYLIDNGIHRNASFIGVPA